MELCTTLDMIVDQSTKALQASQFRIFHNIIIGIHGYDIPSYNLSGRAFLEEQNIKLENYKEEAQKADKLSGG